MTKNVLLAIKGLQFDGSPENAEIETVTSAEYYIRNNSHYLIYEEAVEGFTQTTRNVIKFREHSLELVRRGLINVHMIFEENKKNMTNYATPFGNIMIGIDTKKILLAEEEELIRVDAEYALEVNYEHFADCHITIRIQAQKAEDQK